MSGVNRAIKVKLASNVKNSGFSFSFALKKYCRTKLAQSTEKWAFENLHVYQSIHFISIELRQVSYAAIKETQLLDWGSFQLSKKVTAKEKERLVDNAIPISPEHFLT